MGRISSRKLEVCAGSCENAVQPDTLSLAYGVIVDLDTTGPKDAIYLQGISTATSLRLWQDHLYRRTSAVVDVHKCEVPVPSFYFLACLLQSDTDEN